EVAPEVLDTPYGALRLDERVRVSALADDRAGQERRQMLFDRDRAAAGAASAMRRGEGLVEVDVHHVKAQVAGAYVADQRVEVRAIAVHLRARTVHHVAYLEDVRLEQAERAGYREHHARHPLAE